MQPSETLCDANCRSDISMILESQAWQVQRWEDPSDRWLVRVIHETERFLKAKKQLGLVHEQLRVAYRSSCGDCLEAPAGQPSVKKYIHHTYLFALLIQIAQTGPGLVREIKRRNS